jgi:hypothetical protein
LHRLRLRLWLVGSQGRETRATPLRERRRRGAERRPVVRGLAVDVARSVAQLLNGQRQER